MLASHFLTWVKVRDWVELLAALLYLLDLIGVFRVARTNQKRILNAMRLPLFIGLVIVLALGWVHGTVPRIAIAAVLIVGGIAGSNSLPPALAKRMRRKPGPQFTYRDGLAMGRLAQMATGDENTSAVLLERLTPEEQLTLVQTLLDEGARLRRAQSNFRPPARRNEAAQIGSHFTVNKWLDEGLALLEVHFGTEAFRNEDLTRLTHTSTVKQVIDTIDDALKPLHNFRNELTKR